MVAMVFFHCRCFVADEETHQKTRQLEEKLSQKEKEVQQMKLAMDAKLKQDTQGAVASLQKELRDTQVPVTDPGPSR